MELSAWRTWLLSIPLLCAMPVAAHTQAAITAPGGATDSTASAVGQLEEIVVTAEKRESTAQTTAAALTVTSGADLDRQQITDIRDLNSVLPNVQIYPLVNSVQIAVRGIGSTFIDPRGDPAVAASVNGLYFVRALPNGFSFLDVARVETVEGPQGTLYGRNAAAGALNIITNQPTNKFEGTAEATYGSLGEKDVTAVLNLPVDDTLAVRLAFNSERRDGYVDNYYDDVHSDTGRIAVRWAPTDDFVAYLQADYVSLGGHGQTPLAWPCAGAQPYAIHVPNNCSLTGSGGYLALTGQQDTSLQAYQLHLDYDFGWAHVTSISGYIGTSEKDYNLPNGTYFTVDKFNAEHDYSQEVRISGNDSASHAGGISWVTGAYIFDSYGSFVQQDSGALGTVSFPKLPQKSQAGFAQASFGISDQLQAVAGIRYTHDQKGLVDALGSDITATGSKWTYKVGLDYQLTPVNLLYAHVSTGYVSGGPNGGSLSMPTEPNHIAPTFAPETVTAYEIGSKNRFIDNRLQVNGDVYLYNFDNYQVYNPGLLNIPDSPIVGAIQNVASVKTYGVEFNGRFALTPEDQFSASITWAHGTFSRISLVSYGFNSATGGFVGITDNEPSGSPLINLPEWLGLLGYDHTWRLQDDRSLVFSVNSKLSSKYYLTVGGSEDPYDAQKSFTTTDLNLGYHLADDRFVFRAWVKNIENTPVNVYGEGATFHLYSVLPPRTYGVTVSAKF